MAAGQQQQQGQAIHWRDRAIAAGEVISDTWEVAKSYAGRLAEWILFICMFINIVEMVPTIQVWSWLVDGTLIVQMITLDVAGFGLATLAAYVRRIGNEEVADKAERTGKTLIWIMVISLLSVTIKTIWPDTATFIGYCDDGLILVRVAMTVYYGHIMHVLRQVKAQRLVETHEEQDALRAEIAQLQRDLAGAKRSAQETERDLRSKLQAAQVAQENLQLELSQSHLNLQTTQQHASSAQDLLADMELAVQAKIQLAVETAKTQMKAEMLEAQTVLQAEARELKAANTQLKTQLKETKEHRAVSVKPAVKPTPAKVDVREFIYSCLNKNEQFKLSEIAERLREMGVELSEPSISRYRKDWREGRNASSNESSSESSAV